FRVWDLRPDGRPVAELQFLAELHSGFRVDVSGTEVALTLPEYQERWKAARSQWPHLFAANAPEMPAQLPVKPPEPTDPKTAAAKPNRPESKPDYAGVIARVAANDRPPWPTLAAGLADTNDGVRKAALELIASGAIERPVV